MTEYLDIVDENDQVVGRDTRRNVHDQYRIHRGIHVFVVDSAGRILVQRRSAKRDYYPGYFDVSVGGQVASGESYEQAATRELQEELGCDESQLGYVADYDAFSVRQREKRRIFVHHCEGPFRLDPGEVESAEFFTVDQIRDAVQRFPFTEGFKRSLAIYLRSLQQ